MFIEANHEKLQYSGRIDWENPKAPVFIYPCTSLGMKFTGTILRIHVKNKNAYWDNFMGCIIDGQQLALPLLKEGEAYLDIPVGHKEKKEHEVLFFKRQDACHELTILGIEIEDGCMVLDMPEKQKRKLEFYGDSVSAGEVSEAVDYIGKPDPEHNGQYSNSWYSYAWITARKLKAQIHDIAQGGIALMDDSGWFYEPEAVGMETVWDRVHGNPFLGNQVKWDFTKYVPQVVVVALGQNDSHPEDYMKENYGGIQGLRWRSHYGEFLEKLRNTYPKAQIVCCTTLLEHDASWDRAIRQVVRGMKDSRITQYVFRRSGRGTPGHLRIQEAEEMAEELSAYIDTLETEGWD